MEKNESIDFLVDKLAKKRGFLFIKQDGFDVMRLTRNSNKDLFKTYYIVDNYYSDGAEERAWNKFFNHYRAFPNYNYFFVHVVNGHVKKYTFLRNKK